MACTFVFLIERKFTSTSGESYIDMGSKYFEDRRPSEDHKSVDAPPPLPVKKKSIQRTYQCDPIYENVPFVYYSRGRNMNFITLQVLIRPHLCL